MISAHSLARLPCVEVRVRPVDRHGRCMSNSLLRDVAVHVERNSDRQVGPNQLANAPRHLAVHVRVLLRHSRAVVRQQHAVPRTVFSQHVDHFAHDPVERVFSDRADRTGARVNERHTLESEFAGRLQEPCRGGFRASELIHDLLTPQDALRLEAGVVGRYRRKTCSFRAICRELRISCLALPDLAEKP